MIEVREATEDDLESIAAMTRALNEEAGYDRLWEYDEYGVIQFLGTLIEYEHLNLFVVKADGRHIGALGVTLMPLWVSHNVLTAQEIFWWIHPKWRKKGAGKALLDHFEEWARDRGVEVIFMSAVGCTPEEIEKVYERRGFEKLQTNWVKKV